MAVAWMPLRFSRHRSSIIRFSEEKIRRRKEREGERERGRGRREEREGRREKGEVEDQKGEDQRTSINEVVVIQSSVGVVHRTPQPLSHARRSHPHARHDVLVLNRLTPHAVH